MRVVVAPDKLRGSLGAEQAARAIAEGVHLAAPQAQVVLMPIADGGEGTAELLASATGGRMVETDSHDALGRRIRASFAVLGDTSSAVIEMAAASGLQLIAPNERRPLDAATDGTGELIRAALDEGAARLIIAIGGSATTDGGAGMARALGVRFLDRAGVELAPGGAALSELARIDCSGLDARLKETEVWVACDVDNPLTGPDGAARVYAPQKGATPEEVDALESALEHYSGVIERDVGVKVRDVPGAGAAGGLGAGLVAFLGARLRPGIDLVLDLFGFDEAARGAHLVITAEGRLDGQTARGKGPTGVASRARRLGIPVVALAGSLGPDADEVHRTGVVAYFALPAGPVTMEEAYKKAYERLAAVSAEVVRLLMAAKGSATGEPPEGPEAPGEPGGGT